jgi:hypothetical protein
MTHALQGLPSLRPAAYLRLRACARKSVLFRPEAPEGTLNFLNYRDFVSKFKAQRHQVFFAENYILQGSIKLFLHT